MGQAINIIKQLMQENNELKDDIKEMAKKETTLKQEVEKIEPVALKGVPSDLKKAY